MTPEQTEITKEVINRYQLRIVNNSFEPNPYYVSPYSERKEVLEKINELKQNIKHEPKN